MTTREMIRACDVAAAALIAIKNDFPHTYYLTNDLRPDKRGFKNIRHKSNEVKKGRTRINKMVISLFEMRNDIQNGKIVFDCAPPARKV